MPRKMPSWDLLGPFNPQSLGGLGACEVGSLGAFLDSLLTSVNYLAIDVNLDFDRWVFLSERFD